MGPSQDAKIESTIRNIIEELYSSNKLEELTVKRVRAAAEKRLELPVDWFRHDDEWKDRSSVFIKTTTLSMDDEQEHPSSPATKQVKRGKKRQSDEPSPQPPKRPRKAMSPSTDNSATVKAKAKQPMKSASSTKPTKPTKSAKPGKTPKTKPVVESEDGSDDESEVVNLISDEAALSLKESGEVEVQQKDDIQPDNAQSDSEMSSVIDDDPPPKKRKSSKVQKSNEAKQKTASKAKELDPKEDEIKKLKDWLKKCGMNKRWLELDKMNSHKQKTSYLKQQLADIGMDGRYSLAKAKEIRERRELQEELEEAQAFAQTWGTSKDSDRHTSALDAMVDMGIPFDDDDDD